MLKRAPCKPSGFTLIEFAMVALLIGLIATMVLPSGNYSAQADLDAAAQEVAAALRFARDESMRSGAIHGVRQETSGNSLRVFRIDNSGTLIYDVYHPVSRQLWDIQFNLSPHFRDVVIDQAHTWRAACSEDANIAFSKDGTPVCTDPALVLLEQGNMILASGNLQRVVTIDGFTGRVSQP
jgi:prepilin-type N-terminal cleavage/methylation domain-containing protein